MNPTKKQQYINRSIAHELRQPLSVVVMISELAIHDTEEPALQNNEKIQEMLQEIRDQAVLCSDIIKRMNLSHEKVQADFQMTSINQLIEKALHDISKTHHNIIQNVTIEKELQADLHKTCLDRVTIYQVLMNLLINAIEAMRNSDQKILTIASYDAGPGIKVSISDTGTGMRNELNDKIFEPYFSTKDTDGHGIGLAVCRNIMNIHKGKIEFSSEENFGSSFTIFLPREQ